jgi:hypothetical protein
VTEPVPVIELDDEFGQHRIWSNGSISTVKVWPNGDWEGTFLYEPEYDTCPNCDGDFEVPAIWIGDPSCPLCGYTPKAVDE